MGALTTQAGTPTADRAPSAGEVPQLVTSPLGMWGTPFGRWALLLLALLGLALGRDSGPSCTPGLTPTVEEPGHLPGEPGIYERDPGALPSGQGHPGHFPLGQLQWPSLRLPMASRHGLHLPGT